MCVDDFILHYACLKYYWPVCLQTGLQL